MTNMTNRKIIYYVFVLGLLACWPILTGATQCTGPMAQIPTGCFDMGDNFDRRFPSPGELPVHEVCLSAFEMDVHEVTNAEYALCVAGEGCTAPSVSSSGTRDSYYGNPTYDDFPVIYVDWYQARDYCTWADKRLPTDAEREYAARGGLSGKMYPWGDAEPDCTLANYNSNYCLNDTSEVESYPANGYGLYDMAGNVFEWVNDWWDRDYYSVSPTNNPQGPASGTYRVVRDASFTHVPGDPRVALRWNGTPDHGSYTRGFRCARSLSLDWPLDVLDRF